ncbi:MAG: bifunctional precorrin-2 dehydrogenase/sirohydrochlorin ferrochelatase [Firmicutes bacterium]|nr:bifunctional precorrin-2 dehydrogenase/sirohydrochlorin ferrochelatase [Bacillota bacterium]
MKFPLFIELDKKRVLVVGGGKIGGRRAQILKRFGAEVCIIDPKTENADIKREFKDSDTEGFFLVLACTNDKSVNARIGKLCRQRDIFVSVADSAETSTFFFPALCDSDDICVGLVSKNGDEHKLVKNTAEKIRDIL